LGTWRLLVSGVALFRVGFEFGFDPSVIAIAGLVYVCSLPVWVVRVCKSAAFTIFMIAMA
tara:strand:+ start:73 stop:252 length:180 start_codon:yes stop_codon:yes gene_type:complete